jgi:hypothetical protein
MSATDLSALQQARQHRAQAERALRLARNVADVEVANSLRTYAALLQAKAAELEARVVGKATATLPADAPRQAEAPRAVPPDDPPPVLPKDQSDS